MISLPGSKVPSSKGGDGGGGGGVGGGGTAVRETYSTHAISEETRILFTSQLRKLREEEETDSVSFPPTLDNIERKYLHHLADQLGLASKSRGKGDKRFITVYKKNRKPNQAGAGEGEDLSGLPPLDISPEALEVLQTHIRKFRLTDDEREILARPQCPGATGDLDGSAQRRLKRGASSSKQVRDGSCWSLYLLGALLVTVDNGMGWDDALFCHDNRVTAELKVDVWRSIGQARGRGMAMSSIGPSWRGGGGCRHGNIGSMW